MDWDLRTCAHRGHETYAPTEPDLRERVRVRTPAGEAWRCLRCATFVVGPPRGEGPADRAPEVPRGRALRDRRILRLIAVERWLRTVGLLLLAVLVLVFRHRRTDLHRSFLEDFPLLRPFARQIGWNIQDSHIVRWIDDAFSLTPTTLVWVSVGLVAYAALQAVEGAGLWLARRWGEYLSVVATAVFLPLEMYELTERVTALRVVLFLLNLAVVVWLVASKRLFGVRGGAAAQQALHRSESLLTVERAAAGGPPSDPAGGATTSTPGSLSGTGAAR
ncbi:DUF2127 domain-containing protein [Nakamurella endophytica]|uniref:DUF2127 domain-containing protein n=1 Tax=Nakamurella endophytica TaxID=1748367 RepID=A0A917SRP9_9ACTN|nr:DUF2127 domain-containing protein [Nakamurella endophytica]GGL92752.1 hypothetical protein GCM10011594_10700 [Nakamurella endophytica]